MSSGMDYKTRWRMRALVAVQLIVSATAAQWANEYKTPVVDAGTADNWWSDDQWSNTQPIPNQQQFGRPVDPWQSQDAWSSLNDEGSGASAWQTDWGSFNQAPDPVQPAYQQYPNDPYLAASQPWDAGSGNFGWDDEDAIYPSNTVQGSGFGATSWHDSWDTPVRSGGSPFDKIDTDRIPPPPGLPIIPAGDTTQSPDSWWIQPDNNPVYTLPPTERTTVLPPWYANPDTTIAPIYVQPERTTQQSPTSTTSSTTTTTTRRPTTTTRRTTYWDVTTENPYWEVTTQQPTTSSTGISIYDTQGSLKDRFLDLFFKPGILAAIIGGAVVGLLAAILLVFFIVYRMRKKDEGSYALDEPKSPAYPYAYQKANTKEFYA